MPWDCPLLGAVITGVTVFIFSHVQKVLLKDQELVFLLGILLM